MLHNLARVIPMEKGQQAEVVGLPSNRTGDYWSRHQNPTLGPKWEKCVATTFLPMRNSVIATQEELNICNKARGMLRMRSLAIPTRIQPTGGEVGSLCGYLEQQHQKGCFPKLISIKVHVCWGACQPQNERRCFHEHIYELPVN